MLDIATVKNWFWHSETLLWAFLSMLAGVVWSVLSVADLSPLLSPQWLSVWAIFNGIVTGYLRMRNTKTVTVMTQPDPEEPLVPVKMLTSTRPPGA